MTKPLSTKTIDGYDLPALGAAIKKLCLSYGVRTDELAQAAGINGRYSLDALYAGHSVSEPKVRAVIEALGNATKSVLKTPADVMAKARAVPEITSEVVDSAIAKIARNRGLAVSGLDKQAHVLHPSAFRKTQWKRMTTLEQKYHEAQLLGFSSLGELLIAAADKALPAPRKWAARMEEEPVLAGHKAL